ncbi:hypothetical protein RMN57_15190 [Kitasatospora sp. CM 4170]|uniref:Uncharacterized protein n=1 Tax=Kitasatospora aburaviensis TaxID=67265 RepID=A0ABW1ET63_9ACTN|nr:hypothetical protein [Kitasatospora sp. CM 4170]WNM45954.1 hypothetical protein RMN57_15190 [Kitasatospora sp. CM 4170]
MDHLRYFYEYGVDTPLWPHDMESPYGHPTELARLPISAALRAELSELADRYQSSLDQEYPPDPSPWPREEQDRFNARARAALVALRRELGPGWTVDDRFVPVD